jgi:hypothetical protein
VLAAAPIPSPENKEMVYDFVQVQVPAFCNRQVLVKVLPGVIWVSSGMVTSIGFPAAATSQVLVTAPVVLVGAVVLVTGSVLVGEGGGGGVLVGGVVGVAAGVLADASVRRASTVW